MTTIHTIGYERRSMAGLISILKAADVRIVLDVREIAYSARPECRGKALAAALAAAGIGYRHMPEAGNPFRPHKGDALDVDECLRLFRASIVGRPNVLANLHHEAVRTSIALLCYERDSRKCHRGVIVEELQRICPDLHHVGL